MIKLQAPSDHNWTHLSYPRTLYDAFKGQGDMHLSEPTRTPLDMGLVALFVFQLGTIIFMSFLAFYLVAYG